MDDLTNKEVDCLLRYLGDLYRRCLVKKDMDKNKEKFMNKFKKIITAFISLILMLTLSGCAPKRVREFLNTDEKAYDPRKVIGSGEKAIKNRIKEIVTLFKTKM